jgi:transposase
MPNSAPTSLPHRQGVQARGLLWASDGVANEEIARRCGVDSDTVRRWRSRFAEQGVAGVGRIAKGRGRKLAVAYCIQERTGLAIANVVKQLRPL